MTTNNDLWADVGPNLGGVAAEALCAYELWRAASNDYDVDWVSGYGHDIEVRNAAGRTIRVNAKRAWQRGAPPDHLECSPLHPSDGRPLDAFALVVLEDEHIKTTYTSPGSGRIELQVSACSDTIFYLPAARLQALTDSGDVELVSRGKSRVRLPAVASLTTVTALLSELAEDRH